jgi:hypothetical protein
MGRHKTRWGHEEVRRWGDRGEKPNEEIRRRGESGNNKRAPLKTGATSAGDIEAERWGDWETARWGDKPNENLRR